MEILSQIGLGFLALIAGWGKCVETHSKSKFPIPNKRLTKFGATILVLVLVLTSYNAYSLHTQSRSTSVYRSKVEKLEFAKYVELAGSGVWKSPNKLPSGSVVQFRGFRGNVVLAYGNNEVTIPPSVDKLQTYAVLPTVIGEVPGGSWYNWQLLLGVGNHHDGGWVVVQSTVEIE